MLHSPRLLSRVPALSPENSGGLSAADTSRRPPSRRDRIPEEFLVPGGSGPSGAASEGLTLRDADGPGGAGQKLRDVGVDSEIGRLRRVFVHTPGREVELMTPKTATELLYNDIIQYKKVQEGHAELRGVLSLVSEVLEVEECLSTVLELPQARQELLECLTQLQDCPQLLPVLADVPAPALARSLICGVPLARNSLETFLSPRSFSFVPLPNMYFMRDSSMVVGRSTVVAGMASPVRRAESLIMGAIYRHHPNLRSAGTLFDGCQRADDPQFTIEGGDVLIINRDLFLIGISERTTPRAVDTLIDALVEQRRTEGRAEPFNVLCVILPRERSTIHLDMIFTVVNHEQAVVYAPYILGRERSRVVRVRVKSKEDRKFTEVDDLLLGLRSVGVRMDPILCGGDEPLHQQREQWNSGANMFAFAPGKVLCYAMHEHTVRACEDAGFKAVHAQEVLKNPKILESSKPLVVTLEGEELARGGGGPRCMTCPVLRDPL